MVWMTALLFLNRVIAISEIGLPVAESATEPIMLSFWEMDNMGGTSIQKDSRNNLLRIFIKTCLYLFAVTG